MDRRFRTHGSKAGAHHLNAGAHLLKAGAQHLKARAHWLNAGAHLLQAGARLLNAGAHRWNAGAHRLNAGAHRLNARAHRLNARARLLNAGANRLNARAGRWEAEGGWGMAARAGRSAARGVAIDRGGARRLADGGAGRGNAVLGLAGRMVRTPPERRVDGPAGRRRAGWLPVVASGRRRLLAGWAVRWAIGLGAGDQSPPKNRPSCSVDAPAKPSG